MNSSMPSAGPVNAGFFHGSQAIVLKNPRTPARCGCELERGEDRERGEERRDDDPVGRHRVQPLPAGRDARFHEFVVNADRRREQEQQDEGEPGQRVAEDLPAVGLGTMLYQIR